MADTPPKGKAKRGRPKKQPEPKADLPLEELAGAAAEAASTPEPDADPLLADTPPGGAGAPEPGKGKRGKRVTKKGTQQIEDALTEILQIPAVPAAMFGDQWMAAHFTDQGRALANRIAVVSERNPVLRGWCERALEGESIAVLLMAGLMYAAPPLMHFGIIPGGQLLGVPVLAKAKPQGPGPVPAAESPPAPREPVPAQQYGGSPVEPATEPAAEQTVPEAAINADADRVTPAAHFVGGENGDGPPLWTEQMIDG